MYALRRTQALSRASVSFWVTSEGLLTICADCCFCRPEAIPLYPRIPVGQAPQLGQLTLEIARVVITYPMC